MNTGFQTAINEIENELKEIISDLLESPGDGPAVDVNFLELGINSVLSVELVGALNQKFGIELGIEVVFDYPSIKALADFLAGQYQNGSQTDLVQVSKVSGDFSAGRRRSEQNVSEVVSLKGRSDYSTTYVRDRDSDIAIIGISGRFAGSETVEEFWEHLQAGDCCIGEITRPGWDESDYYHPDPAKKDKSVSKWGGMLKDVDKFDPLFFNISPLEAKRMDPQQRLFLEEAFKAFEDAGYAPERQKGNKTGVFVGCRNLDYKEKILTEEEINPHTFLGNDMSILAARISYFLDLKGPSIAVDTACSSSLMAIHLACESIRKQESEIALAGGVFVISSPEFYILASKTNMLSFDGKCKTFDDAANGIVPGEGVGAMVLKPLTKAIADGDHIYGVIKGSSINQDGKTKGITAPSMLSQKELIWSAYQNASINPETVSFIEAHGTGTKLGDPIEIKALIEAFRMFTDKTHFCAVNSHKPNFGHTITAAGIAGVFSILMALKHKKLYPLISFNEINKYIDLHESPFFFNTKLGEWKSNDESPLRAGISSFGFSGTNCHVIIEEPPFLENVPENDQIRYYPFFFSAKTKMSLKRKIQDLHKWLVKEADNYTILNISYTLLTGRDHYSVRSGFIASSIEELKSKISEINSNGTADGYFTNKGNKLSAIEPMINEYGQRLIAEIQEDPDSTQDIYENKLIKLLELYVKGYNLSWERLFGKKKTRRISLPTYPFKRERYWVSDSNPTIASTTPTATIHPLLHKNTSNLAEQRFTTIFTGKEFFLADHIVANQSVLPGAAYLELAREAIDQAVEPLPEEKSAIRLKNIVWARPIVVKERPVKVHIGLFPEENGEIAYEIYSQPEEDYTDAIVHSQGMALLNTAQEVPSSVDLALLQAECRRTLTASKVYETFKSTGIEYGPAHRGIEQLFIGENQVLARITLPLSVTNTKDQFILHPSIMDAALQASLGLSMKNGRKPPADAPLKPSLPFALEEIEILSPCDPAMWAYIRPSKNMGAGEGVKKLDIDLLDDHGKPCVRMRRFTTRDLKSEPTPEHRASLGALLLEPVWKEQTVQKQAQAPEYAGRLVILCEQGDLSCEEIAVQMSDTRCLVLQSTEQDIGERFQAYAIQVFEELQTILKDRPKEKVLVQMVINTANEQHLFTGLSGLLKTARLENPILTTQLIEMEPGQSLQGIIEKLYESGWMPLNHQIRYQNGKRFVAALNEIQSSQTEPAICWKDNSVYLITGGAGGLGLIFSKEIARQTSDANLILTGRSPLGKDREAKLKELETRGAHITYKQVDVTDRQAIDDLVQGILRDFGKLNGIIHAAGLIKDNFIIKKSSAELKQVLAPKVQGLVNLDQACKDIDLDLFILFSSVAGNLGNPGQVDYAAANAFLDAYARYRNDLVESRQRYGRTLSINWPLWKEGGMSVGQETRQVMKRTTGMVPMQSVTGISALYQGLTSGRNQFMVIEGDLAQMRRKLLTPPAAVESGKTLATAKIDTGSLLDKVQSSLVQTVCRLLKIRAEDIDVDTELSEFGFDSITFTQLTNELNQKYHLELIPTIFFEHPTIHSFAEYLTQEHSGVLAPQFAVQIGAGTPEKAAADKVEERSFHRKRRFRFRPAPVLSASKPAPPPTEAIAIVGMSGVFPKARNVNEFWTNLKEGRDCISEIPEDRWDWREYVEAGQSSKWGGFIDGVAEFDPLFFGISPREAEFMDPQQRLLMTHVWQVIEDTGHSPHSLSGTKTAIFVGTAPSGYGGLLAGANIPIESYSSTGLVSSVGPNRMSYFLDIHGPSEPIETACSSSLVAVHRAVNAIVNGSCEMAIAGGVNTIITPDAHISFSKAGMLCADGRCKTFSSQANGYVRGEGVGMLFLKKLTDAEEAEDHIYGVIKGTAENHGGRANSLTAPNPKAQAGLLVSAYEKSGIDPKTVTYIEAHGSGTELGDPIEINGLKTAFKELYLAAKDSQVVDTHCGLGSVKSNIGHLELAAGVAGVIKVLLQMKHKTLVESLHCEAVNPYIKLKDSPFYIVQKTKEWEALKDADGKDIPRRAGVSSFGFGGANAHVVIEEYVPQAQIQPGLNPDSKKEKVPIIEVNSQNPAIIILSAKNDKRLKEQVRQLLEEIRGRRGRQDPQYTDSDLADIAYTLQVGREPLEERLAVIISSLGDLEDKLKGYLAEKDNIEDLYLGQVKRHKEILAVFDTDEDMAKTIEAWIGKKKYSKLLNLWVKGLIFDWNKLYQGKRPRRISLPTYPFSRESYWVPENPANNFKAMSSIDTSGVKASRIREALHPLLHRNTSNFFKQRYSSIFSGDEFFLADHVIKGQRVLPGVAYLEMARVALEAAAEIKLSEIQAKTAEELQQREILKSRLDADREKDQSKTQDETRNKGQSPIGLRLKNIVWSRPVVVQEEAVQIHIGLYPEQNKEIHYEIYSQAAEPEAQPLVYNQGRAVWDCIAPALPLDLKLIQAQCSHKTLSAEQCYQAFRKVGFDYGPGQQGILEMYLGADRALAKLRLPVCVSDTEEQFGLHPTLLDAALQASLGLVIENNSAGPLLPFALHELEILDKCPKTMWAFVRLNPDRKPEKKVRQFDIDLSDDLGNIVVRFKGLSAKALDGELSFSDNSSKIKTLLLEPVWKQQAVTLESMEEEATFYEQHFLIFCELEEKLNQTIKNSLVAKELGEQKVSFLFLKSFAMDLAERFQTYAAQVFREIQDILQNKAKGKTLLQLIVLNKGEQEVYSGLFGLLKTAQLENSKLKAQLLTIDPQEDPAGIIEQLQENWRTPSIERICYQNKQRLVANWEEIDTTTKEPDLPWKEGGSYLITGGAGGLGRLLVQEIADRVQQATLFIVGHSFGSKAHFKKLQAQLHSKPQYSGIRLEYKQLDITDKQAVTSLIKTIQKENGDLDGIIHAAGIIKDNFILKKTDSELNQVLAPKIKGLINLDQATKDSPLEFFICFSSIAGVLGNVGQADYVCANAFMDSYAKYRNSLVQDQRRRGRTLSINWPLWQEGGMHVTAETLKMLRQNMGLVPLKTVNGLWALYQSLASGKGQIMVLEGNLRQIKQKASTTYSLLSLNVAKDSSASGILDRQIDVKIHSDTQIDTDSLLAKVQAALTQTVSKLLKVKTADLDGETELNEFGFDSITFSEFVNKLNQEYKLALTPAIFFEYSTLCGFARYLTTEHQPKLAEKFTVQTRLKSPVQVPTKEAALTGRAGNTAEKRPGENAGSAKVSFTAGDFSESVFSKKASRLRKAAAISWTEPWSKKAEPIAIVGMSGIFPQARDLNEFWDNLITGKDCISEIPLERWDWRKYYGDPCEGTNKTNIKWGGFIEGVSEFDPLFFGVSPKEAKFMDPQQRLLMTYIWKVIEDAGYSAQSLSGTNTGIFAGTANSGYNTLITQAKIPIEGYSSTGMVPSIGPNRMSYFLNIHGPSEAIETACSSSLIAVHRAVSVLENGTCDMAIAGGINTLITPELYISFNKAGMLCEDGRCKTFSDQADGYVRGEGVGMLFLKRLTAAKEAGDHIYGIIRGSSENHGGRANSLTSPNPKAQAEVLIAAYTKAGVDPKTISYIEAHGTGTKLGDPIEINGLKTAFKKLYETAGHFQIVNQHCGLGSVKTNIGHLELSAGIAGLIKILLQLKHKKLVKNLHCETINPYIQLENSPFYIVQETKDWEALKDESGNYLPRRAGVSSFGFGGANAHVVLEEYVPQQQGRSSHDPGSIKKRSHSIEINSHDPAIIILSAKNEERLKEQVRQLLDEIRSPQGQRDQQYTDSDLSDIAFTLQVGREHLEERLAVIVGSLLELKDKLEGYLNERNNIEDLYLGHVKNYNDALAVFTADKDLAKVIEIWFGNKKYHKLLDLWVKGLVFDWNKLYQGKKPRRISLPTYPFARETYWVPKCKGESSIFSSPISDLAQTEMITDEIDDETAACDTVSAATFSSGSLQEELRASLAKALFIEPGNVDIDMKFLEMGLDSILGAEWIQAVNKQYHTSVSVTKVYDYSTIREFTKFLAQEIKTEENSRDNSKISLSCQSPKSKQKTKQVSQQVQKSAVIGFKDIPKQAIAIIGMAGQFPKAQNLSEFWDNIANARDCVTEIPTTRWSLDQYYDPAPLSSGKTYCKWMGVLEGADKFDPAFFNISRLEAESMDPQQRLFLKACWECIEDAGISSAALFGSRCGVFVGCAGGDYGAARLKDLNTLGLMGRSLSILSGRISYFFNLKGPCFAVDTACSSSLLAITEACNSLLYHTSDLALAGGVCVLAGPTMHIMTSQAEMLSKDGRCFTFDARANGFVPGEGVGVILLKRLADAVRDNDPIYGVIRGWGINQDGKTNGITAPSVNSQIALEKEVYEKFGINPENITLVEAHGTGTKIGDPIEVEALTAAFKTYTQKKNYCALSSVKSNIGHLLTAAGIAGVIKVLLSLRHKKIPPTANYNKLNPHISLADTPFYISEKLQPWETAPDKARCAGVSAFGFSGTNVHLIIEENIAAYQKKDQLKNQIMINSQNPAVIVLSAKNEERLKEQVRQLLTALEKMEIQDNNLASAAYTLQVGREAMEERLAVIVKSVQELADKLHGFLKEEEDVVNLYRGEAKPNKDKLETFAADEDMEKTFEAWISKRKYSNILELWVKGLNFDWQKLYGEIRPSRISLPTYPFAEESYWQQPWAGQGTRSPQALAKKEVKPVLLEKATTSAMSPVLKKSVNSAVPPFPARPDKISLSIPADRLTARKKEILKPAKIKLSTPKFPLLSVSQFSEAAGSLKTDPAQIPPIKGLSQVVQKETSESDQDEAAKLICEEAVEQLQEELASSLSEILFLERNKINLDQKFSDLSMDSILGVEWIKLINKRYGTSLAAIKIYDYSTIREFADFFVTELNKNEKLTLTNAESIPNSRLQGALEQVDVGKLGIEEADKLLRGILDLDSEVKEWNSKIELQILEKEDF